MKGSKKSLDLKYILFLAYNITYVISMIWKISQSIYFLFLGVFIFICILEYFKRTNLCLKRESFFYKEWKSIMIMYFLFAIISIIFQIINQDYQIYLLNDLVYLIVPPLFAFFWINVIDNLEREKYLKVVFFRYVIHFLLNNIANLNLVAIKAITWSDTKSSVFESSYAHDFLLLQVLFLCMKKKKMAFICWILCLLSFKRLSFILSTIIYIVFYLIQLRNLKVKNQITATSFKGMRIFIAIVIVGIIIFSAYFMQWLAVEDGAAVIMNSMGIDIEKFMTGRLDLIRAAYFNISDFNGLGTIINYFENSIYRDLGNMHCDVLRVLWETTIIGLSMFAVIMTKNFYKNWAMLTCWIYMAFITITSHSFHSFTTWMIFYMIAAFLSADIKENRRL